MAKATEKTDVKNKKVTKKLKEETQIKSKSSPKAAAKEKKVEKTTSTPATNKTTSQPATIKEKKLPEEPKSVLSPDNLLKIWYEGWKKTFVLRGRSSRFELWTFMLINSIISIALQLKCSYIMSPRFLREANYLGYSIDKIETYIITAEILFYIVLIVPLFPLGSMLIRRMHDLNRLAWNNHLEPVFMGVVVLSVINIAISSLTYTDLAYVAMFLSLCFVVILYGVGFYGLKFLIMTMFYRGDKVKNNYGEPKYTDEEHEEKALNLSCGYFLFIITIGLLYLVMAIL